MRYKTGDRVKIKSLDWYNENKTIHGDIWFDNAVFAGGQSLYCGCELTIRLVTDDSYYVVENDYYWTDEMIEGLVEPIDCKKCGLVRNSPRCLFMDNCPHNQPKNTIEIPKGWILKDENGNVINATRIVLEKKEYPKTYEECCEIIHSDPKFYVDTHLYSGTLESLYKLLICRDAYWKIAGEEMGLGKPWEPDWNAKDNHFYTIHTFNGKIECSATAHRNAVIIFPTEEMRDAFYENFKELIEQCKELL